MMTKTPLISIIFPAKNEGVNVKRTLDSLFSISTDYPFEVILVDDASVDGCCDFISTYSKKDLIKLVKTKGAGASNARNIGADQAKGDYYFFCDAHLEFEDKWIDRLMEPLLSGKTDAVTPAIASMDNPKSIGFGQTLTPSLSIKWNKRQSGLFETAVLPGGCFAITRSAFEAVGGFETGFKTWGHEDVEISIKLWLFGFKCHVQPDVTILHLFRKKHPYKVKYVEVNYNLMRMAYSHFNDARIYKCRKLLRGKYRRLIEPRVIKHGVLKQREEYFRKREYDDDWYFGKFGIDF
ncbi:glycosyltransferase [Bacillus sp. ISL-47]|uniref:glycosyltransferase family 2 protein n=1 Tax=Bacillus sp. ISL-47 TaxID=2819130 RepID=UPI001BEC5038|nr:glycosyltransferase [Bacillus sp. ISL-47]MBT2686885.1 glycosyltransferase [Bacillus sp. ISL-47]MBT2710424.1 glycosyltransferase [Pseudomonas sp. ISL-84]